MNRFVTRGARGVRRIAIVAAIGALALGACSSSASPNASQGPVTLHALFMKQAAYSEADVKAMDDAFTAANPNITVQPEFVGYDALHDKIVTDQVGGSGTYDVVLMDTPWPAEFVQAGIVTDITDKIPADFKSGVFDSAWTAAAYQGKYYGVPWINDTKFFFYNTKMFADAGITAAPKTWDEVVADAKAIKAKGIVQYPMVASWKQVEAVICDWTQLAGVFGGANFVDDKGNATFNSGGGLGALKFMKQLIDDGLMNPASLGLIEDDVNATMSAGQAAMALNWTYGYAVMNDPKQSKVAGQIDVVASPGEGSVATSGVNGGMSLAVTKSSKNPDAALKYALFIASEKSQEMDTTLAFPMWKASFDNPDITKANPAFFAAAKVQFAGLVARPVVPYYTKLSNALQVAIQTALQGKATPEDALNGVAAKLPDLQK
jgi:multiple sugar transport system substrate-binding protein